MSDQISQQDQEPQGHRARRVLTMKQFVPSPDWINQNVVAPGKGTHVRVARIIGIAQSVERKTHKLPNGEDSVTIIAHGQFEATKFSDGEIVRAPGVYLPMAYAEQLESVLKMDGVTLAQIDVDIGLEATGKTIPYEWTVTAFIEGPEADAMQALRVRRAPRPQLLQGGAKQEALPAPDNKSGKHKAA